MTSFESWVNNNVPSLLLSRKATQSRSKLGRLFLAPLLVLLLLLLPQLVHLEALLVDNVVLRTLLPQVFAESRVLTTCTVFNISLNVDRLSIQITGLSSLLVRAKIQVANEVRIKGNHFRLKLVQETLNFRLASLFNGLVRVDFHGIEVGLSSTWYDD